MDTPNQSDLEDLEDLGFEVNNARTERYAIHKEIDMDINIDESWNMIYLVHRGDEFYSTEAYPKSLQDLKHLIRLFKRQ